MRYIRLFAFCFLLICGGGILHSQEDLLSLVEQNDAGRKEYISATFKGTRLINFHTIEVPGRNSLEFRISHHFGDFNSGGYNLWGLDGGASIRLGLEYSKNGRLAIGIGRSSLEKAFDGFLKYKLLKQTVNNRQPVTITLFAGMYYITLKDPNAATTGVNRYQYNSSRLSYAYQVIIARKFSERFSLQISPTLVHYNLVEYISDNNDLFVLAFAARYKFTKRAALSFEYGFRVNQYTRSSYFDSVGLGFDLETGGHVFQMFITNSAGMIEPQFFGHTTSSWQNWGLKLGFNISRMFSIGGRVTD